MVAGVTIELREVKPTTFCRFEMRLGLGGKQIHGFLELDNTADDDQFGSFMFVWVVVKKLLDLGFFLAEILPMTRHGVAERGDFKSRKRRMSSGIHCMIQHFPLLTVADVTSSTSSGSRGRVPKIGHAEVSLFLLPGHGTP